MPRCVKVCAEPLAYARESPARGVVASLASAPACGCALALRRWSAFSRSLAARGGRRRRWRPPARSPLRRRRLGCSRRSRRSRGTSSPSISPSRCLGRSNRAGNASEAVEEKRASVDPSTERRAAEAAAERRRNGYFGGTGAEGRSPVCGRPVLATDAVGGARAGAGKAMDAIASEVLSLRAERRSTTDPLKVARSTRRSTRCRAGGASLREADRVAEERSQKVIGLDGRIGTPGQVTSYELEQGLIAANPGSFLGTIGAGISASRGGSIEDRRKAGQAGNAADGLVGFWQPPLDPKKASPPTFLNERPRKEIHAR